jgi:hypothetical protein
MKYMNCQALTNLNVILLYCERQTHYQVTAVQTGDSTTAVAMEQLYGHVVSPAMREHAIMEETFSVLPMPGLYNED